jgi:hypothetical protein
LANQKNKSHSRRGGLQVAEDMDFQHREWTAQRFGWAMMALLLVAAIAGLFGAGPASNSSVERTGLRLEYERFVRLQKPTSLRFHFTGDRPTPTTLSISREYLASVQVENITPQPEKVELDAGWLIYSFSTRQHPGTATFHLQPEKFGMLFGEARLAEGEPISFRQLVYP